MESILFSFRKRIIIKLLNFKMKKIFFLLKKININYIYITQHNNKIKRNKKTRIIFLFFYKYNINDFIHILKSRPYFL
ncbi:hypothetical protein M951_chr2127 (nucleomorph) [Lotharella oceanica]|uniref:Uncharacterized protein n=1 Tax=Lotharella oceanica TaxID=641309 RepID=A0A060DGA2_9EUKA|nr:hypothetical protein M951_chr2127 [Lotharella oceanica]